MKQLLFVSLLSLTIISGCKKDEDSPPSDTAATITITAPAANSRYANTSTLLVRGSMNDLDILKNAKVEVKNKATGAVLFSQTTLTGNLPMYSFDWSWPVTGIAATFTATVKITSTDQYDYQTTKEVDIILEP
jgi:hypothetical protein